MTNNTAVFTVHRFRDLACVGVTVAHDRARNADVYLTLPALEEAIAHMTAIADSIRSQPFASSPGLNGVITGRTTGGGPESYAERNEAGCVV